MSRWGFEEFITARPTGSIMSSPLRLLLGARGLRDFGTASSPCSCQFISRRLASRLSKSAHWRAPLCSARRCSLWQLSLSAAGLFFFWSGVLAAFSFPVAASLSSWFGLVNTMVFTHIPSSLCLILAAFAPSLTMALGLLLVRAALSQMDVPTRSSHVMAVVTEAERTAAASFTSVPRSLAASLSPAIAGALFSL